MCHVFRVLSLLSSQPSGQHVDVWTGRQYLRDRSCVRHGLQRSMLIVWSERSPGHVYNTVACSAAEVSRERERSAYMMSEDRPGGEHVLMRLEGPAISDGSVVGLSM